MRALHFLPSTMTQKLTVNDHNRDHIGLKYVYPVMSRRAGGLSIGVNFNSNNACNWRCVYCQVPDLIRGTAPELDFELLAFELKTFLHAVLEGDFYERFAIEPAQRVIKDIAISGNGEPTSLIGFEKAIDLIGNIATELDLFPKANFVLITNGSLVHQNKVQHGLTRLNQYGGQVWFKLDSVTDAGRKRLNHSEQSPEKAYAAIVTASQLCQVKLQTCLLDYQQTGLEEAEKIAYLNFLKRLKEDTSIENVTLYTIARPSFQPEAVAIKKLPAAIMDAFAEDIRALGYQVAISY